MDVFRDAWINQVRILTDAVDDITTIDDFLAVSENHILEDVNSCVTSMQSGDIEGIDRSANAIRGRCGRICGVVTAEMDNYEPGYYTERVLDTVGLLTGMIILCSYSLLASIRDLLYEEFKNDAFSLLTDSYRPK